MLKVMLHFGRRQPQMDPLRAICPKQKWFTSQCCFCSVFSPSCYPDNKTQEACALLRCQPQEPCGRGFVLTTYSLGWRLGATQPAPAPSSPAPPPSWEKHPCPFLQAGLSSKPEGFESTKPRSIRVKSSQRTQLSGEQPKQHCQTCKCLKQVRRSTVNKDSFKF